MIDNAGRRFLHSLHFVSRGARGALPFACLPLFLAASLAGCAPRPAPKKLEDTQTSGRITVVVAADALDLIRIERDAFVKLYPEAQVVIEPSSSRGAIESLFRGNGDLAVVTRELEVTERQAARKGGLELEGYRFARDAIVLIVHPDHPVQNLAVDQIKGIYRGTLRRWSEVGGANREIAPVVQPADADLTAAFSQQVMGGEDMSAPATTAQADSDVVRRVMATPDAIGYVTLRAAGRGARALRVSAVTGLAYSLPDAESVYKGEYPLTRFYNFYVRASGPKLASGFITYVTSREGQNLVHESGLVPTSVPVRFVRRSPMLGAH